jgi:hypothetical protein
MYVVHKTERIIGELKSVDLVSEVRLIGGVEDGLIDVWQNEDVLPISSAFPESKEERKF